MQNGKKHPNHPGFKISMRQQPPNLPNTSVLDLGFLRSLQWKQLSARTIADVIQNVETVLTLVDSRVLEQI